MYDKKRYNERYQNDAKFRERCLKNSKEYYHTHKKCKIKAPNMEIMKDDNGVVIFKMTIESTEICIGHILDSTKIPFELPAKFKMVKSKKY